MTLPIVDQDKELIYSINEIFGPTLQDRFWSKVDKGPHPKGCWIWTASLNRPNNYGTFWVNSKIKQMPAHVVSYLINKGPYERGKLIMHTCDNRQCVNPEHLVVGTHLDNNRDTVKKGRYVSGFYLWSLEKKGLL